MGITDRNIAKDAAINPSKIGWGVKDRHFLCDFDGADGDAVASTFLGFQALDVGGTALSTCKVGQQGGTDAQRNSVAIFTLGDGAQAEKSYAALYSNTLWSSTGRTLTARCRITDLTKLPAGTGLVFGFGLCAGTDVAADSTVLLGIAATLACPIYANVVVSGGGATASQDTGVVPAAATNYDLEVSIIGGSATVPAVAKAKVNGIEYNLGSFTFPEGCDIWHPVFYALRDDAEATDAVDICIDYLEVVQGR